MTTPGGSDHFPIFIDLITFTSIYRKKSLNLKSTRTNWEKVCDQLITHYQKLLEYEFQNLTAAEKYKFFIKIISDAINDNTPKKLIVKNSRHRNSVSWWDAECDRAKRLRSDAFKKWRNSRSLNDFIELKKYTALAKRTFKKKENKFY